jgi:hypothetical protein
MHKHVPEEHAAIPLTRWIPTIHPAHVSYLDGETNLVPQLAFLALFLVDVLTGGQHNIGVRDIEGQQAIVAGAVFLPIFEKKKQTAYLGLQATSETT